MLILVCSRLLSEGWELMPKGGNPSAEEMEEALESGATQVNNVVHSFRLSQTSFDKKVRHRQRPLGRLPSSNSPRIISH